MSAPVAISAGSVPRLAPGARLRFDERRAAWVVLAPERLFVPDAIALEVIKRCDGAAAVAAIVDDLATTFEADRAVIEADVIALLQDLADKGVMTA
ncbi:MAG: pyrroloquinoline quinone biosynthesis peptide chaperone PqqD [Planctomycetota bacterium]|jgi:pyrroloquinoline quinone biosynthesis protein D